MKARVQERSCVPCKEDSRMPPERSEFPREEFFARALGFARRQEMSERQFAQPFGAWLSAESGNPKGERTGRRPSQERPNCRCLKDIPCRRRARCRLASIVRHTAILLQPCLQLRSCTPSNRISLQIKWNLLHYKFHLINVVQRKIS